MSAVSRRSYWHLAPSGRASTCREAATERLDRRFSTAENPGRLYPRRDRIAGAQDFRLLPTASFAAELIGCALPSMSKASKSGTLSIRSVTIQADAACYGRSIRIRESEHETHAEDHAAFAVDHAFLPLQ